MLSQNNFNYVTFFLIAILFIMVFVQQSILTAVRQDLAQYKASYDMKIAKISSSEPLESFSQNLAASPDLR